MITDLAQKNDDFYLAQKKIMRTSFFKRNFGNVSLYLIDIDAVFELFFAQFFHKTFRKLRKESPLNFVFFDRPVAAQKLGREVTIFMCCQNCKNEKLGFNEINESRYFLFKINFISNFFSLTDVDA